MNTMTLSTHQTTTFVAISITRLFAMSMLVCSKQISNKVVSYMEQNVENVQSKCIPKRLPTPSLNAKLHESTRLTSVQDVRLNCVPSFAAKFVINNGFVQQVSSQLMTSKIFEKVKEHGQPSLSLIYINILTPIYHQTTTTQSINIK